MDTDKGEIIRAYFASGKKMESSLKTKPQNSGQGKPIWHKDVRFWKQDKSHNPTVLHKEIILKSKINPPAGRAGNQKSKIFDRKLPQSQVANQKSSIDKQSVWKKEISFWSKREEKAGWSLGKQQVLISKNQAENTGERSKKNNQSRAKLATKKDKSKPELRKGRVVFVRVVKKASVAIAFSVVFVLLFSSAAVFAYQDQYKDRALYGTKIFGEDVGGKTNNEIQNILDKKIAGISFDFEIDNQVIAAMPAETGIEFNASGSADEAIKKGKDGKLIQKWAYATSSLMYKISPKAEAKINGFSRDNLEIKYKIDDEKLTLFTQGLSAKFNMDSKNAGLVMNGTEVTVIPAVYGRKIVADNIKYQIQEAIRKTETNKIKIAVEKVNPAILEKDTAESIDAAKKLLNIPVKYTYKGQVFTPDKAMVGDWIVFNTQEVGGQQKLVPMIDPKRVYDYIYGLGSKINIPAINKKVTIENGAKQTVTQEGKDGLAVDVDKASVTTANSMNGGTSVSLELPTYVVRYKTQVNNVLVADWSKYIEINLSTQTLNAYTAGGNLVGSWRICSGKAGFATPTGTHLVRGKSSWIRMTGMQGTSEYYNLYPIKWATWFTGSGHAMHDAYWRSSFGYPASHGCVNMPDAGASFIYNWAPVGTPVIVHY